MRLIIIFLCVYLIKLITAIKNPPNIVVIIGDDIGWNDFGFHGSSQISTPNIDALGYNGVVLNQFYTQPTCTPSRAAFLTGKYPIRYGYQGIPIKCGENRPLPKDIELLPQKLKKFGYKTHLVGKWHLNAARKTDTPTRRGFDTHFGYWNGFVGYFNYFAYQTVIVDNKTRVWSGFDLQDELKPQWEFQGKYATDLFTDKSLEIIENHNSSNQNQPLFLYLAHLAAHTGANGTELGVLNETEVNSKYSFIKEPMRRKYAEIVNQLDNSVGKIVKKLEQKKMLNNTIIVFFSDNGAQTTGLYQNYGSNYPLKGLKFTLLEGGVRGSALFYSPFLEKKGYINNNFMHITDLHATLLELAGEKTEKLHNLDGISQWNSISRNLSSIRKNVLLNIDEVNGFSGIIGYSGRYKYLNGSVFNGIYDFATGDTGRINSPEYNFTAVIQSSVNQALQSSINETENKLTPNKIELLRNSLDISDCKGQIRTEDDPPCSKECLFDLWNDPCETKNIIYNFPAYKENLKAELNEFMKELIPSTEGKVDLNSNPLYCNNTWFPWLDKKDGCYKNVSTRII